MNLNSDGRMLGDTDESKRRKPRKKPKEIVQGGFCCVLIKGTFFKHQRWAHNQGRIQVSDYLQELHPKHSSPE